MRVIGMNTTLERLFFFSRAHDINDMLFRAPWVIFSWIDSAAVTREVTQRASLQIDGLLGRFFIVQTSVHFGHVVGEFRNGQLWERKCDGDYSLVQTTEKVKLDNKLVTILFIFNLIIASSFTNHLGMQKKAYIWTRTKRGLVKGTLALCLIADWFFLVLFW